MGGSFKYLFSLAYCFLLSDDTCPVCAAVLLVGITKHSVLVAYRCTVLGEVYVWFWRDYLSNEYVNVEIKFELYDTVPY